MTDPVDPQMRALIKSELNRIARQEDVTILCAVESGSRAWGFHSFDSDYDVRFVYLRPARWHLRLDTRRDVIEMPISGDLDISGWELGKALRLAVKSNAVLPEWLQSPIVYADIPEARAALTAFCQIALTRRPVTWHYLSLMQRQMERLRTPEGALKLKRYFYVLRPALALRWLRMHETAVPPMNIWQLLEQTKTPDAVQSYVRGLIAQKLLSGEMGVAETTHPAADMLIAEEASLARAWLADTNAGPDPANLWETANALHADLTERFAP